MRTYPFLSNYLQSSGWELAKERVLECQSNLMEGNFQGGGDK